MNVNLTAAFVVSATQVNDHAEVLLNAVPVGFAEVQRVLAELAKKKPDWFPLGFQGIHAVSNPELFAGFDPKTALFYLSTAGELVPGFKPATELQEALQKIKAGETLSFNNEYAVETIWHEILHGITQISALRYPLEVEPLAEGVVQLAAWHSYHLLIMELGGAASQQEKIIRHGLAYSQVTKNLNKLMAVAGMSWPIS